MSAIRAIKAALAAAVVFLAVKVAPFAIGWFAGQEGVKWLSSSRPLTSADVEREFASSGMTFYVVLKDNFPEDYKALLDKIAANSAGAQSRDEAERLGYEATSAIRQKNAASLLNAPDENLHAIFTSEIELLNAVYHRETPAVCASFANKGPSALSGMSNYMALGDRAAEATFRGIAAGIKTPDPAGAASDDDWALIGKRFLASGGTQHDIEVMAKQLQNDPGYCAALIGFLNSIQAENSDAGHRVRAAMAYEMAKQ